MLMNNCDPWQYTLTPHFSKEIAAPSEILSVECLMACLLGVGSEELHLRETILDDAPTDTDSLPVTRIQPQG